MQHCHREQTSTECVSGLSAYLKGDLWTLHTRPHREPCSPQGKSVHSSKKRTRSSVEDVTLKWMDRKGRVDRGSSGGEFCQTGGGKQPRNRNKGDRARTYTIEGARSALTRNTVSRELRRRDPLRSCRNTQRQLYNSGRVRLRIN